MMDDQAVYLRAVAELETVRSDLRDAAQTLGDLSLWRPAAGLKRSCEAAIDMLDRLAERLDRKLVVTLVGPCGSGKSTLLNALGGKDDLSPTGHRRPTTQSVVVFCRSQADAQQLAARLGSDEIRLQTDQQADALDHLILIDTPDTDSTQQKRHIPIIHQAITLSDVLICVFDGENPKRRDHTDFLAPYVKLFSGKSLVVAVNKCDRLAETELKETILPEFSGYIQNAWPVEPANLFCISARSHLENPAWDPQAVPKHGYDQFDRLQALLVDTFNRSGYSVDRRMENARRLQTYIDQSMRQEARKERAHLKKALMRMKEAQSEALDIALDTFQLEGAELAPGIHLQLYQRLSQRWLGPVGWLVAIWTRILVFGAGIASLLRFGNPLHQVFGVVSVARQYADAKKALTRIEKGFGAETALYRYDASLAQAWPDIAEMLIDARFASTVRQMQQATENGEGLKHQLSDLWRDALESELSRTARRLSSSLLQLLFNLPVLGVLIYTGWMTAGNFFRGSILSGDFFLHAFWTIVLVLLLSFFLLQGVIRLTMGKQRLIQGVFSTLRDAMRQQEQSSDHPLQRQVVTLLQLGQEPTQRQLEGG